MSLGVEWVAALISAGVALVTALITTRAADARYRDENKVQFEVEKVALALLNHPKWKIRTFEKIRRRIGGFDDDELRRLLVRAGAIRFYSKETNTEFWGLYARTSNMLHSHDLEGELQKATHNEAAEYG